MADFGIPEKGFVRQVFTTEQASDNGGAFVKVDWQDSAKYHNHLRILKGHVASVPAGRMGISATEKSAVIEFIEKALNFNDRNTGAPELGVASPEFMKRLNDFTAAYLKKGGNSVVVPAPIFKPEDISGAHLAAVIDKSDDFLGHKKGDANRALVNALRSIPGDNPDIKKGAGRIETFATPQITAQTVPGTDGQLAYNAQTNTLIIG